MIHCDKPYVFKQMNSVDDFRLAMKWAGYHIPAADDLSALSRPIALGERMLKNSICIQPLEAADSAEDGSPTLPVIDRYTRFAKSGAAVIWYEACAVTPDGRDGVHQMMLTDDNVDAFRALNEKVDAAGGKPYKVLQLTHSGRCSGGANGPRPKTVFKNPLIDGAYGSNLTVVSDNYIDDLLEATIHAAELAEAAGFDAIDFKLCHNYLFREMLAAFTRRGKYGGSFENRTRFALEGIAEIRRRCPKLDVAVRLNAYDALPYPYGWGMKQEDGSMTVDLTEPKRLVKLLYDLGVRLFNITSIYPRIAPAGRGFAVMLDENASVNPLDGERSLLLATRQIKAAAPKDAVFVGTGMGWYEKFNANVAAGGIEQGWFDIAGFGRQAIADFNAVAAMLRGAAPTDTNCCIGCDRCYKALEAGYPSACISRNKIYNEIYKGKL